MYANLFIYALCNSFVESAAMTNFCLLVGSCIILELNLIYDLKYCSKLL